MPASRPSRTELRRAPAPIRSRHSPIPPGVKAGKRRAIGPGPKQLVGPSADPVAGSTLSALASNHHIDWPAAATRRCPTATTDTGLRPRAERYDVGWKLAEGLETLPYGGPRVRIYFLRPASHVRTWFIAPTSPTATPHRRSSIFW